MNKRQPVILLPVSMAITALYVTIIEPFIDKPTVLTGFFALLYLNVFLLTQLIISRLNFGKSRYLVSAIVALASVYLTALSTLNTLGLLDVVVVTLVMTLILAYIGGPLRKNRSRN